MILGYSRNEWQNSEISDKKGLLYKARNEWQNLEMSDKKRLPYLTVKLIKINTLCLSLYLSSPAIPDIS